RRQSSEALKLKRRQAKEGVEPCKIMDCPEKGRLGRARVYGLSGYECLEVLMHYVGLLAGVSDTGI
ncbi:MAG: hypothetical protein LR015_09705, partial [Verrucomicrobia bacterium]|nr:hypothetical protein [Verrucomicrobiota bacterium]